MVRKQGLGFAGLAAVMTGLMLVSGAASAFTSLATIKATWNDNLTGGSATGTVPGGPAVDTAEGGLFEFDQNPVPVAPDLLPVGSTFVAFCLEFNEGILDNNNEHTYDLVALSEAPVDANNQLPSGMGVVKANEIATLIGFVYGIGGPPLMSTNATQALAVQIAIWEIVHETVAGPYNVTADAADWTGAAGTALVDAQTLLSGLAGYVQRTAAQVGLLALVRNGNDNAIGQDFLVWEKTSDTIVPIPAAAWLLGSGLIGLFGIGRRRKTA